MESTDPVRVAAAHQYLTAHLPAECVVPYQPDSVARAEEAVREIITGKGPDPSLELPVSNAYQVDITLMHSPRSSSLFFFASRAMISGRRGAAIPFCCRRRRLGAGQGVAKGIARGVVHP